MTIHANTARHLARLEGEAKYDAQILRDHLIKYHGPRVLNEGDRQSGFFHWSYTELVAQHKADHGDFSS